MGHQDVPPDEAWWERQLLRNEKDAIAIQERFQQERRPRKEADRTPASPPSSSLSGTAPEDLIDYEDSPYLPDLNESDDTDYRSLAAAAMEFSVAAMRREDYPAGFLEIRNAALRVTTHLAGGHGIGYDDGALCGNIVKCRWALADVRFCLEGLETLMHQQDRPEFAGLLVRCRDLLPMVEERIGLLRERVWW